MGKTKKKDHRSASLTRRQSTREVKQSFLIVCEGVRTEPDYFKAFRMTAATVKAVGQAMNTTSLVSKAISIRDADQKKKRTYDQCWVVFDKDDFEDFNEAIKKAHKLGFHSAWTNEAFELWYYLHFEYLDTGIGRAAYIKKLEEVFRKNMGDNHFEYKKGNPDIYSLLQQYGREDLAKRFAQQLRALYTGTDYAAHKPCTMVDKLVEELEHPELLLIKK